MIHVIVDSTSGVTEESLAKHKNLHLIPLILAINGEYVPETEATVSQVIEYSEATKKSIPTSQPSTGDFLELFDKIPAEDAIIILCITTAVSGTYNGAVLAAKQSKRDQIAVINTRTTAIGILQMAQDALEFIDAGVAFDDLVKKLLDIAERMRTTFTVDSLEYLRRGGRIGKAAGIIGSILKIKPCIYLNKNNEVDVLDKVRTRKKAVASLLNYLHNNSPCKRIGIVHIENIEGAKELQRQVQSEYPDIEVTVTGGTPVLACYLGPGLVGIIFECA
ncbi:MAG: DegV family protein [Dialister sp.]|nr:DegV family protein [Dialister sp.]